MPRYALKKGDIYQALQKGSYGQRFSELGANIKEWYKQALGKSVVDAENDLNYDADNNLVNTDLDGNQITYVPVSGIYNLDINLQDADIFQGLFRYALSIRTQGKLLESLPLVNSILDTLEDPDNAPKDLEKFDKNIYNVKGILKMANKNFVFLTCSYVNELKINTTNSSIFKIEPFLYKPLLCEFKNDDDDDNVIKIDFSDNNKSYNFLVVGNCFDKTFLTFFMKNYYEVDVKHKYTLKILDNNVNTLLFESSDIVHIENNYISKVSK
jgi:hypothetical protein